MQRAGRAVMYVTETAMTKWLSSAATTDVARVWSRRVVAVHRRRRRLVVVVVVGVSVSRHIPRGTRRCRGACF